MKQFRLIIQLIVIVSTGCSSAKYTEEFKGQKKDVDTLTIITPITSVINENSKIKGIDSSLTRINRELIEKTIFDLLSSKYKLEKSILAGFDKKLMNEIYNQIEKSPKTIKGFSTKNIITAGASKHKFGLLFVFDGYINSDFPPHYNTMSGLATDRIIINPFTKPHSDLRLLIIDTQKEEIVFYNSIHTSNYDPRVSSEIEQITRNLLRKIYYK